MTSCARCSHPKLQTIRARARQKERGRGARTAILVSVGAVFWAFAFGVLHRLLAYFRGVPEIGPLLAGKLLGLILVSFFSILLLSNIITALSSFFLARDLDLLASAPVDWLSLYSAKLLETCVNSSWMVVLHGGADAHGVRHGLRRRRRVHRSRDRDPSCRS